MIHKGFTTLELAILIASLLVFTGTTLPLWKAEMKRRATEFDGDHTYHHRGNCMYWTDSKGIRTFACWKEGQ